MGQLPPPSKPWYKSTTLWINLVGIAVMILNFISQNQLIKDPQAVALLLAVLNILNRFRTSLPISG